MSARRASAAWLAGALLAAACSMTRVVEVPDERSRYDRVPDALMGDFRAARERYLRGDFAPARAGFERLLDRAPDAVTFGLWWQECEAQLSGADTLRRRSEERAVLAPGVVSEILAARAQTDPDAAEAWLARAEARDPDCVWVHHGRAFVLLSTGREDEARIALERALAADPGHLPARRLEVRMLSRDGATDAASMRLAGWLERASGDPRVLPADLAAARLDAALLALASQDVGRAEDELDALDPAYIDAWRLAAARACVARERGDLAAARRHVDAARALAPREILPAVQEALLFDEGGRDPFRARAAWVVVRELAGEQNELASAFETLRARVRLERIDRRAAGTAQPPDSAR